MFRYGQRVFRYSIFSTAFLLTSIGFALVSIPKTDHIISQKGKRFEPVAIRFHTGEHVTIVNDDDNLTHHVYIDDPDLTYDSGDQEPGDRAIIAFPKSGDFEVLCGIHPMMKLAVRVQ